MKVGVDFANRRLQTPVHACGVFLYFSITDSFLLLLVSVRSRSLCRGFSPERLLTRAQHSIPFVLR